MTRKPYHNGPREIAVCETPGCGEEFARSTVSPVPTVRCPKCRKQMALTGVSYEPDEATIYALAAGMREARGDRGGVVCLTDEEEKRFRSQQQPEESEDEDDE